MTFDFEPGSYVVVATFQVDETTSRIGRAELTVHVSQELANKPILKVKLAVQTSRKLLRMNSCFPDAETAPNVTRDRLRMIQPQLRSKSTKTAILDCMQNVQLSVL